MPGHPVNTRHSSVAKATAHAVRRKFNFYVVVSLSQDRRMIPSSEAARIAVEMSVL